MQEINKQRVAHCFSQALTTYDQQAFAQQQINEYLVALLVKQGKLDFSDVLEIGCGTGQLTSLLAQHLNIAHWHLNDLCDVKEKIGKILAGRSYDFFQVDAEYHHFPTKYDLIVSASTLQWFNAPLGFVQRSADKLNSQGYLLLATFAPENLLEIRQLTGVGLNYPNLAQWQQTLQRDFEILHLHQQQIELAFNSPLQVLQHLKQTGVTALSQGHWNKAKLQRFMGDYQRLYALGQGKVRLTYQPIFILARKRT